jgi:hypothetical protein
MTHNPSQGTVEKELREAEFTGFKVVTEKYHDLDLEIGKTSIV